MRVATLLPCPAIRHFSAPEAKHLTAAVDFTIFCVASIFFVGSLLAMVVAGVIAAATILVFVATVISGVILVAVAAMVTATGDFHRRFWFVRRYSFPYSAAILIVTDGTSRIHSSLEYAPSRCLQTSRRFCLKR